MKRVWNYLDATWCKLMHPAPMWPVGGYYRCPVCLRAHPVPWEHQRGRSRRPAEGAAVHATSPRPAAQGAARAGLMAPAVSR